MPLASRTPNGCKELSLLLRTWSLARSPLNSAALCSKAAQAASSATTIVSKTASFGASIALWAEGFGATCSPRACVARNCVFAATLWSLQGLHGVSATRNALAATKADGKRWAHL